MIADFQRVLVLAPHTDDGEIGCGGSIARFVEEGRKVYYVAFSSAEESVPEAMARDILKTEVRMATKLLGISPDHLFLLNYSVRKFPAHRQAILEDMIKLGKELNPDIVLLPSTNDTHQDHQTISQEGFRAFKQLSIIGYEMPHNNLSFSTHLFTMLNQEHVNLKAEALKCYKSQAAKAYATVDSIISLARVRGTQIGVQYAEAFEVVRWIIK
jgi:LmbE family N-acetylglucosaminyl deacetylase